MGGSGYVGGRSDNVGGGSEASGARKPWGMGASRASGSPPEAWRRIGREAAGDGEVNGGGGGMSTDAQLLSTGRHSRQSHASVAREERGERVDERGWGLRKKGVENDMWGPRGPHHFLLISV